MNRIARFATTAAAALGLATPVAPAAAQGDARPTVAIVFFNNHNFGKDARDLDGLGKGIADLLITDMAANPNVRLIDRAQVQKLIDDQRLAAGSRIDREVAVRVGRLAGAQHVIFGGFDADAQGNVRIDARAVGVEQGAIEYTERVQDRADNMLALIGALAGRMTSGMLLPGAPAPTGAQQAGAPAAARPLPMKYAIMYGKALDLTDRGDRAGAGALFDAVLKDFPDFEPAKKAKARLSTGG